jgi:hypothetical protein
MQPITGKTYRLKNGEQILVGVYAGVKDDSPSLYKFFIFDDSDDRRWFLESEIIEVIDPKERKRLCGKNRRPKNGDFSDYEVRCMVASYCRDITIGMAGWGVPFTVWVELKGLAKFEKGSLYKLDKPTCECEMCDGRRAAHEELEECVDILEVGDRVKVINPANTLSVGREGFISEIVEGEIMVDFTGGWRGWYNKKDVKKLKYD